MEQNVEKLSTCYSAGESFRLARNDAFADSMSCQTFSVGFSAKQDGEIIASVRYSFRVQEIPIQPPDVAPVGQKNRVPIFGLAYRASNQPSLGICNLLASPWQPRPLLRAPMELF